jgi:hypothetical protein
VKCEYERLDAEGKICCGGDIKLRKAMTAYHFEGEKNSEEDPNRDFYACEDCYKEYTDHWTWMWDEYYAGQR